MRARVGVDVGGTFTDLVAVTEAGLVTAKVSSTPADQSEAVMAALAAAGDLGPVDGFAHGTTVATNALLERRGARVALVTTAGFADVIEIARQDRPSLYDLAADRPEPLVPRDRRFTVAERMGPDGVVTPLDEASLAEAVTACAGADVEAVAVGLLFGYLHPEHERRVGDALRSALPEETPVVLSSEVLPEFREYERFATTVADAYLAPVLGRYLRHLAGRLADAGVERPLVMQSSGGVAPLGEAAGKAAAFVLSGPAGGVVGAARVAEASGPADVLTFDMGGTSTDVATVAGGQVATTTASEVAGVPIGLPMVDIHTVSAGGGSIAWVDAGGALRVGPTSAGADPGPAGYGRGGTDATVTDADLYLGWLPDGATLGGEVSLDRTAAEGALAPVADQLGLDIGEAALGVVRVANAAMAAALRVISVERGLDPRRFALVAFGGAGGMHAAALAEDLGITTVLVPRTAGVLSAYGLAIADRRDDLVAPLLQDLDQLDVEDLDRAFEALEGQAADRLGDSEEVVLARAADVRYRGQSFELTVDAGGAGPADLAERFHDVHQTQLGYRMDGEPTEVVAVRVVATDPTDDPMPTEPDHDPTTDPVTSRRQACIDGEWADHVPVYDRAAMGAGSTLSGPAVVEQAEATVVVGRAWSGRVDPFGTLVLERRG